MPSPSKSKLRQVNIDSRPKETELDLFTALRYVYEGEKIRRPIWPEDIYCFLDIRGCLTIVQDGKGTDWLLSRDDFASQDWMILKGE